MTATDCGCTFINHRGLEEKFRKTPERRMLIQEGCITPEAAHHTLYQHRAPGTKGDPDLHLCPECGARVQTPHGQEASCGNGHSMMALGNALFIWPSSQRPRTGPLPDATPEERRNLEITQMARQGNFPGVANLIGHQERERRKSLTRTGTGPDDRRAIILGGTAAILLAIILIILL